MEDILSRLRKSGATAADIRIAILLESEIIRINALVFPNNPAQTVVVIGVQTGDYKLRAHYSDRRDCYAVYPIGLRDLFGKRRKKRTLREEAIEYAIHEVRHRLQEKQDIRIFRKRAVNRENDPDIRRAVQYVKYFFVHWRCSEEKAEVPNRVIRHRFHDREFDANVVQRIALMRMPQIRVNEQAIRDILLLKPTR